MRPLRLKMLWLGLAVTFGAGIALGLLGGGGSVLVVPVLVYLFGVPPIEATAYSLVVVGATSLAGTYLYWTRHPLPLRAVILFGVPSVAAAYMVRAALVPQIPPEIAVGRISVARDTLIMLAFAGLTVFAGVAMLRPRRRTQRSMSGAAWAPIVGGITGALTAFVGAGGGFLVFPALTLVLHVPVERAVAASLALVAAQSIAGAIGAFSSLPAFNFGIVLPLTATMLLGMAWGVAAGAYVSPERVRQSFGWLLLTVAVAISIQQLR